MKFVLTLALSTVACGPVTRVQETQMADNRRPQGSIDTSVPAEDETSAATSVPPALTPVPASNHSSVTSTSPIDNTAPTTSAPDKGSLADPPSPPLPSADNVVLPEDQSPAPVIEELEIEERTGQAEDFSPHALVFDLDEYGKDKRQTFEIAPDASIPEWVSGLGFLFSEGAHPVAYTTSESLSPFQGWGAHASVRLFQYDKHKATIFRLSLFGVDVDVEKETDEHGKGIEKSKSKGKGKGKAKGTEGKGKDKDKDSKRNGKVEPATKTSGKKRIKGRSRLVLELAVKNGRPLLQLQTKAAGKKPRNSRIKGKARLPANQEVHLVASLRGNMLRLFSGTHLIGEVPVDDLPEKWVRGELVVGAVDAHGKAPFVGFLRELEFADSLPIEYQ